MLDCECYSSHYQYQALGNEQYDGSTSNTTKGLKPSLPLYAHTVPNATVEAFKQIALEVQALLAVYAAYSVINGL